MTVVKTLKDDELNVKVAGRLETVTAPKLDGELNDSRKIIQRAIESM